MRLIIPVMILADFNEPNDFSKSLFSAVTMTHQPVLGTTEYDKVSSLLLQIISEKPLSPCEILLIKS